MGSNWWVQRGLQIISFDKINGKPVQMELDTGSTVSVIFVYEWQQLFPTNDLKPYGGKSLYGYLGKQLDITGKAQYK